MKSLLGIFIVIISLFFNINSVFAFDYAPEIGDLAPSFHVEGITNNYKYRPKSFNEENC